MVLKLFNSIFSSFSRYPNPGGFRQLLPVVPRGSADSPLGGSPAWLWVGGRRGGERGHRARHAAPHHPRHICTPVGATQTEDSAVARKQQVNTTTSFTSGAVVGFSQRVGGFSKWAHRNESTS